MFVGGEERGTYHNCYYSDVAAATSMVVEEKQAHSITTNDQKISIENISATPTVYNDSGITSYFSNPNGSGI